MAIKCLICGLGHTQKEHYILMREARGIVTTPDVVTERNEMVYLNTVDNEFVQLVDLDENFAYIKINLKPESILELHNL